MIFDDEISIKQKVSKMCQSTYLETRRISSDRQLFTDEATKPLSTPLVLPHLDYCSALLSGISQQLLEFLKTFLSSKLFCHSCFTALDYCTVFQ